MARLTGKQIALIIVVAVIAIFVAALFIEHQVRKKQEVARLIAELSAPARPSRGFTARDKDRQHAAAKALGEIGDKGAVEPLLECLNCDDHRLQVAAAVALGQIRDKRAIGPLPGCLKSKDYNMRKAAAAALVSLLWKPETEDQKISFLIAKEDWDGLVKMREKAVEPLLDILDDKEPIVRTGAAKALGDIREKRAVEPLMRLLKDQAASVRWSAAISLGKLRDERAIEPLIQSLKDEDRMVRSSAAKVLANLGAKHAIQPLKEALKKETYRHVRQAIARALNKLEKLEKKVE